MIREDLVTKISENSENQSHITPSTMPNTPETVLTLINKVRNDNGLPSLQIDELLNSTAQTKANDMVENNYFSHTSPTYGTPFEMMQNAGITYKVAGENIAGNNNISGAVEAWMNSENHRANLLSKDYNYTGVAVVESKK